MAGRLDRGPSHQTARTPPPLGQMARLIASFGGFLGRKHDGHPGPKALWEGLQKVIAFEATRAVYAEDG